MVADNEPTLRCKVALRCCAGFLFFFSFSSSVVRFTIQSTSGYTEQNLHLCCSSRKATWEMVFFLET